MTSPALATIIAALAEFEWDSEKAIENLGKHGVSFDEAVTVFGDPLALMVPDPEHSLDEDRWWTIGNSSHGRLVVVWHTYRGDSVRVIGARPADPSERRDYESG